MAAGEGDVPDWRDAAAYAPLLHADRSFIAWEWLRRTPAYRAAAERARDASVGRHVGGPGDAPEHWGLHDFVPPHLATPVARPIWSADAYPHVLRVETGPARGDEDFDLERVAAMTSLVGAADGREHLLISDGLRVIRVDVLEGTVAAGPARLHYRLSGLASAERAVLTLRRLLAFWRTGRFCRSLHPVEARARRWALMLRAHDALASGADQRAIAEVLLSAEAGEPRWRCRVPSLQSRAQRLVARARHMSSGGYRELLQ